MRWRDDVLVFETLASYNISLIHVSNYLYLLEAFPVPSAKLFKNDKLKTDVNV